MASSDFEVVIVGGGAAGIAAARRLRDAGIGCLIVEARPRLGGRAWTIADRSGFRSISAAAGCIRPTAIRGARSRRPQESPIDKTPPPWMRPSAPIGFPLAEQAEFREAVRAFLRPAARSRRSRAGLTRGGLPRARRPLEPR